MKLKGMGLLGLLVWAADAPAAGFALYEHSASALGTAFAGQAAIAQDASTLFANPAGLTRIQGSQLVAGMAVVDSSSRFSDGTGGDGGATGLLPSLYYAMDLRPGIKLGLGLFAPYGLKTEWAAPWTGDSQAILSEVKTVDINPSLAWQVNDRLSLGVGVDYQYLEATFSRAPLPGLVTTMKGDDWGWGYNLGMLYQADESTRVGLSYRSKIDYHVTGTVRVAPALPGYPQPIYADISLPDMASLAVEHRLNARWTVLADATWTRWSVFQNLDVFLASGIGPIDHTNEGWRNAWRFGIGANYRRSETWTWRFGLAYDQTPIPNAAHRTARLPDADRISAAVGARYALSERTWLDVAYMHIFFRDTPIDNPPLAGSFDTRADVLGMQLVHGF